MSTAEDMSVALGINDVHVGYPDERAKLAQELTDAGFQPKDVHLLATSIRSGDKGAILCKLFQDHDAARKRLADVQKLNQAKSERYADKPPSGQGHGQIHAVDAAQNQRMAYALVRADRKPVEAVAKLMGVTVDEVNRMVEAERELRFGDLGPEHVKASREKDTETQEQRIERFRREMAERKAQR